MCRYKLHLARESDRVSEVNLNLNLNSNLKLKVKVRMKEARREKKIDCCVGDENEIGSTYNGCEIVHRDQLFALIVTTTSSRSIRQTFETQLLKHKFNNINSSSNNSAIDSMNT